MRVQRKRIGATPTVYDSRRRALRRVRGDVARINVEAPRGVLIRPAHRGALTSCRGAW